MSGEEKVALAATVEPLVRTIARVASASSVRVALIGGLAVACRLGTAHRPTGDADLVAGTTPPGITAAVMVSHDLTVDAKGADRLVVDGTKIEIIDTEALDDVGLSGIDEHQQLFLAAHRWALETATPLRIEVADKDVAATLPVATPAALVAMKLHPLLGRRREARKRASDAYDLFRLLDAHFGRVVEAVNRAPYGLPALVSDGVRRVFVDEVEHVLRNVQVHGDPAWSQLRAADVRSLGERFGERLTGSA